MRPEGDILAQSASHPARPGRRGLASTLTGDMFSSLSVADYRRLYFGNMAFQLNSWMQQLVFGWLILTIGDSPFWLGVNGAMTGVAMTVMAPIAGSIADSWDRRRSLLITQTTAVTVNGTIAVLFWLGLLEVWHLLLASLAMGISYTFNMPARQALMAELVPKSLLQNATALHTASMNLARIAGPSLAGLLLTLTSPLAVLCMNLVANCWTVSQILAIRFRPEKALEPFRFRGAELAEGFQFCWRTRELFETLMILSVSNLFGLSYVQLLPSLARDSLGTGPDGLGVLTASMGGGALIGSLLLARLGQVPRRVFTLRASTVVICVLLIPLGLSGSLFVAAPILALIGFLTAVVTALGLATVQLYVPNELSGRVFGVYMVCMGLMPLGSFPNGALAAAIGTAHAIALWGLLGTILLAAILAATTLSAQRVKQQPVAADATTTS
ncbi:MAG: MFS transporter [Chloroflexota bacterium]